MKNFIRCAYTRTQTHTHTFIRTPQFSWRRSVHNYIERCLSCLEHALMQSWAIRNGYARSHTRTHTRRRTCKQLDTLILFPTLHRTSMHSFFSASSNGTKEEEAKRHTLYAEHYWWQKRNQMQAMERYDNFFYVFFTLFFQVIFFVGKCTFHTSNCFVSDAFTFHTIATKLSVGADDFSVLHTQ